MWHFGTQPCIHFVLPRAVGMVSCVRNYTSQKKNEGMIINFVFTNGACIESISCSGVVMLRGSLHDFFVRNKVCTLATYQQWYHPTKSARSKFHHSDKHSFTPLVSSMHVIADIPTATTFVTSQNMTGKMCTGGTTHGANQVLLRETALTFCVT